MSFHRAILVAFTALFSAGTISVAFAGCCEWGGPAPVVYAWSGCGGCGTAFAPMTYAAPVQPAPITSGCGGCGVPAPVTYAEPVAPPPPPPPPPVAVATWGNGCGCGRPVVYATPAIEPTPIAPAPIYVVNQGPDYTGPGIMVPYRIYSPIAGYAVPSAYPYIAGEGYPYGYGANPYYRAPGPRFAYRERAAAHPPHGRLYPHRPLRGRD